MEPTGFLWRPLAKTMGFAHSFQDGSVMGVTIQNSNRKYSLSEYLVRSANFKLVGMNAAALT